MAKGSNGNEPLRSCYDCGGSVVKKTLGATEGSGEPPANAIHGKAIVTSNLPQFTIPFRGSLNV